MISLVSKKAPKSESPSVSTSVKRSKPDLVSRERLRYLDAELAKANAAALEIEQRIQRLETIISEAETHHQALQLAILVDNGVSLSNYSAGKESEDSEISKLVMLADSSARAATAAKAALPQAQASLANVREQAVRLNEERVAELNRVIALLADVEAREYEKAFRVMCRHHDRLVGYSNIQQANIGDIRRIEDPQKTPRFALPSLGNSDADPFLRHRVNESVVAESERMWSTVKQRLQADSDADLSDLI
jgi:hypothetical protein